VAGAIRNSQIPIISAVGHETDFTISDFVADVRAPTPSAAAEIVTSEKSQMLLDLAKTKTHILQSINAHLRTHRQMLKGLVKQPPLSSPYTLLGPFLQKLDDIREDLRETMQHKLMGQKMRLEALAKQKEMCKPQAQIVRLKENFTNKGRAISWAMKQQLSQKRTCLEQLEKHLKAIDPRTLLKKGYSIVFREKNDSIILSIDDVQKNESLRLQVSDGQIKVNVK